MPAAMPTSIRTLFVAVALCGCATTSSNTTPVATVEPAPQMVTTPAGNRETHAVEGMNSYSELAARLSETEDLRVDVGSHFTHEGSGMSGRTLVAGVQVMEVLELPTRGEAQAFTARFSPDGRLFDGEPTPHVEPAHIFSFGNAVVVYRGDSSALLAALDEVAVRRSAHAGQDQDHSMGEIEAIVRHRIEGELAIPSYQLELVQVERVRFGNACLGVPSAADFCADAETPGWRFTFRHGDESVIAHADENASRVFFPQPRVAIL